MDITSNIIRMPYADIDPDKILENCKGEFSEVLVLGIPHKGDCEIRSSHTNRLANILWLIKRIEFKILQGDFNDS